MFINAKQQPSVEFNPDEGHTGPTLVHFLSDRADPFKSVLPKLIAAAGQPDEHVLVLETPLSEIMDWTIEVRRHPAFPAQVVVDEEQRVFFEAARSSLAAAMAKIDQIQFIKIETDEDCE